MERRCWCCQRECCCAEEELEDEGEDVPASTTTAEKARRLAIMGSTLSASPRYRCINSPRAAARTRRRITACENRTSNEKERNESRCSSVRFFFFSSSITTIERVRRKTKKSLPQFPQDPPPERPRRRRAVDAVKPLSRRVRDGPGRRAPRERRRGRKPCSSRTPSAAVERSRRRRRRSCRRRRRRRQRHDPTSLPRQTPAATP